jgi:hypothetical protein
MTAINAFDPRYVETYMPEFMTKLRKEAKAIQDGQIHGGKSRAVRQSANGDSFNSIHAFPQTKSASVK